MYEPRVLLDTCALLWLVTNAEELSERARSSVESASIAYVSAISAWEVSLKAARGALSLPMDAGEWFGLALDHHGLTLAPLDVDILIAANALPWHHRDPADRFIIATARKLHAAVVTTDTLFQRYDISLVK
jgi:PIN domain nuclease of toxin-antitoxin system